MIMNITKKDKKYDITNMDEGYFLAEIDKDNDKYLFMLYIEWFNYNDRGEYDPRTTPLYFNSPANIIGNVNLTFEDTVDEEGNTYIKMHYSFFAQGESIVVSDYRLFVLPRLK